MKTETQLQIDTATALRRLAAAVRGENLMPETLKQLHDYLENLDKTELAGDLGLSST